MQFVLKIFLLQLFFCSVLLKTSALIDSSFPENKRLLENQDDKEMAEDELEEETEDSSPQLTIDIHQNPLKQTLNFLLHPQML